MPFGPFLQLSLLIFPGFPGGDIEIGNDASIRGLAYFRVSTQVPHQYDFINTARGHDFLLVSILDG
jgi:hypothetical protein